VTVAKSLVQGYYKEVGIMANGGTTVEASERFKLQQIEQPRRRKGDGGMTRGDWLRVIAWALPIVFMAAVMYVTLNMVVDKSVDHDTKISLLDGKVSDIKEAQALVKSKSDDVEKKQDKMILTIEKIDDKLEENGQDLAAIKTKLKIPR